MRKSKLSKNESTLRAHKSRCEVCRKVVARGLKLCSDHMPHEERPKCGECGRNLKGGHCPAGPHVSINGHLVRPIVEQSPSDTPTGFHWAYVGAPGRGGRSKLVKGGT